MNKAGKVIASEKRYDKNRLTYSVTNTNKYGTFTSTVRPCDEDMDNLSDFLGYVLCERKNYIKTIHRKAMNLYERAFGIKTVYNALAERYRSQNMPLTNDELFLKDLNYQYEIAMREYQKVQEQYLYMKNGYSDYADRAVKRHTEDKKHAEEYRAKLAKKKAAETIKSLREVVDSAE